MINVHKDSKVDFSDNDRYDDMDFTSGLREFKPPVKPKPDYRITAVLLLGYLIILVTILIILAIWKTVYCWNDHFQTCKTLEEREPTFLIGVLFAGPTIMAVITIMRQYTAYLLDRAIVRRTNLTLDRYGDSISTQWIEKQGESYYRWRYETATRLQRDIAPYQIYKGVNTLSNSKTYNGTDETALLPDNIMGKDDWKTAVEECPHLLIYGPSKAGKSTLAQAIVAMNDATYIVIDPLPNKPGEKKWCGIDFVTLGSGEDEWGPILTALDAIRAEDSRRQALMATEVFPLLVVIIDEVLGLVDSLGTIKVNGKTEPIMSHFIRMKGISARHRNIKVILIGQGKNLSDLGLESSTARNNYALIRASRNAATNERAAYIITDEGETPIDVREVLTLSQSIGSRGSVWKTHTDCANAMQKEDNLLTELLETPTRDEQALDMFRHGQTIKYVGNTLRERGFTISTAELQALRKEAKK